MAKIEWFIGMTFGQKIYSIFLLVAVVFGAVVNLALFGALIYALDHIGEF